MYDQFQHDSSFREQYYQHLDAKRRIGRVAAGLVRDNETVALNPGTTTTQIARNLPRRKGLTIVTNAVNIAMELGQRDDVHVIVVGGSLRGGWFSLVGSIGLESMHDLYVDKAFIGCNGIDPKAGLTAYHGEEAAMARTMIQQARDTVVVADASKWGVIAPYRICRIEDVKLVVTDDAANGARLRSEPRGVAVQSV